MMQTAPLLVWNGFAKHTLRIILIELREFWLLPDIPIIVVEEFNPGQFHRLHNIIVDIPILENCGGRFVKGTCQHGEVMEHISGVELVDIQLRNAIIGKAMFNFRMREGQHAIGAGLCR